jgi:MtN3 and saliva related transmembrane protein
VQAVKPITAGEGTRTPDLLITNQLLYQLSYASNFHTLVAKKSITQLSVICQLPVWCLPLFFNFKLGLYLFFSSISIVKIKKIKILTIFGVAPEYPGGSIELFSMIWYIFIMKEIVGVVFGLGLMANAGLFVVQAIKILRTKSAAGVSTFTFAGFSVLQVTGILHGIFQKDIYLLSGMAASLLACGTVTILSIIYRRR